MTLTDPGRLTEVPLPKAWRLMNHGPTVLVTAVQDGFRNVMAVAWAMPVDFDPAKVVVVIDAATHTRGMIRATGRFGITVPPVALAGLTNAVGNVSGRDGDKFARFGIAAHDGPPDMPPRLAGGIAWLDCRVMQDLGHDLILGVATGAWVDPAAFARGRWIDGGENTRTIHHMAAGQFFVAGPILDSTKEQPE